VTLDRGYLISAKDLAAAEHLDELAELGISCLKIEGRKKKPEYVATVTRAYREFLSRLERGEPAAPVASDMEPLVQIYSRGFTGGMYGGRVGRDYVTRDQPDNRGIRLGAVVGYDRGELLVDVSFPIQHGDGLGFDPPAGAAGIATGFAVEEIRTIARGGPLVRQAIRTTTRVPTGWSVTRTSHAALLDRARESFAGVQARGSSKTRLDARLFGSAGAHLRAVFTAGDQSVTVRSETQLAPARQRSLDERQLRDQLGRLGNTPFALAAVDITGLAGGLFLPVRELNRLRQEAVEQLLARREWDGQARLGERRRKIEVAVADVPNVQPRHSGAQDDARLVASVYRVEDARAAAAAGATEVVFDPFLRHPIPPVSRVRALADELGSRGVGLRLRTPTIVRQEERLALERWLALDVPLLSGHLGLVAELAAQGRDIVADYAVNCFNTHTAAEYFHLGASRIVASIELTTSEMTELVTPWSGRGFDVVVYGRPEGMTIEHCVLSAAFDRVATTCRDLCVQKHPVVHLTDPAGYTFAVATDAACRNRLLHSRPLEGSEFLPRLWNAGIRGFHALFNVPGEPVAQIVRGYREMLDGLTHAQSARSDAVRSLVGDAFTRGHFARAV
jgi:putative protease